MDWGQPGAALQAWAEARGWRGGLASLLILIAMSAVIVVLAGALITLLVLPTGGGSPIQRGAAGTLREPTATIVAVAGPGGATASPAPAGDSPAPVVTVAPLLSPTPGSSPSAVPTALPEVTATPSALPTLAATAPPSTGPTATPLGATPSAAPSVAASPQTTPTPRAPLLPPPAIGARSAIVWDATAGVELFSKNPDEAIAPASTAKMLTALVALDLLKLDTRITVDPRDVSRPEDNESTMGLVAGDTLTFGDLLYGMLLPSGSDAARTVARAAGLVLLAGAPGDPIARFMDEMNARAIQIGATNSHFVNPHGDDAPGQYSTARDLLRIADEALKRPDFARVVATPTITVKTVDGARSFALRNTNELLFSRPGIHGVKTGTTPECGYCLVAAQWRASGRVIAVVLGAADRVADATILLDWVNAAYP
jgi:D-alanyl-D-alanine carboxypeptidase (penicillin-binding protein 5/6)